MKNELDSLFFTQLFVSERKQIAMMADAKLIFASPLRDKSLRNEVNMKKKLMIFGVFAVVMAVAAAVSKKRKKYAEAGMN